MSIEATARVRELQQARDFSLEHGADDVADEIDQAIGERFYAACVRPMSQDPNAGSNGTCPHCGTSHSAENYEQY